MNCQKDLFTLPEGHHYINCSYLSPLLKRVEQAGIEGVLGKRTPWETRPDDFFKDSNRLRSLFAQLVKAERADEIAIMPSVSYGMSTVAKNMDPRKGSKILLAGEQFPSNVYAWERFAGEHGGRLNFIPPPRKFRHRGKRWNERILEAIDGDTLLVALGNVHWADGTLFDLDRIGELAREHNTYFVIDGTQSVGALPLDVGKIRPDALICAGYKWLMGPYSIALGYFGPRLRGGVPLEEGWITRKDSEEFGGLVDYAEEYQPGAIRFDMGERSNFILVPMMIAALQQVLDWGPAEIRLYCRSLLSDLTDKLPRYGYLIEDAEWRGDHMFGIRLPEEVTADRLQQELARRNIHVSLRGSAVRISPNVYNNAEDIAMLTDALVELAEQGSGRS